MNAVRPPLSSTELLYQAETEILRSIAHLLADGNVASADWKIDRLKKLGALNERVAGILARYRTAVQDGTVSEVEVAAMEALLKSEETFARAREAGATLLDVLPADADPAIRTVITAWQATAKDKINLAMAAMLQNSGQVYVDTINRTTLQVLTGAMSGREALVRACRDFSETGIPSIVDRAGRQWSTEAYVNMVHRTNVRRVATEVQGVRAQEYGADLVEISAHAGARPLCAPYQGRIFSRSGSSSKYPPLSETSIGEPAGLFGINCGHNQYPFFEGISRQTYAPTQDHAENSRVYDESQAQRKIERSIRKAKREVQIMEALGDQKGIEAAKANVRGWQGAMRVFIDETGRTRRRDREQVHDRAAVPPVAGKHVEMPTQPTPPPRPQDIAGLQSQMADLSKSIEAESGARYIAFGPPTLTVKHLPGGDRGRAGLNGGIQLNSEVASSIEAALRAGVVDESKDVLGSYNQAVNFRTLVHEHMHLHGAPFDAALYGRNQKYRDMLEAVNDLSSVYLAENYARNLGLEWKVADTMSTRSPGYAYQTSALIQVLQLAGKSDEEIRALVLEAKASNEISEYDQFFKKATGKKFAWSFAAMLENSFDGREFLRRFSELGGG